MHWIPVGASLFASNIGSEHFIGILLSLLTKLPKPSISIFLSRNNSTHTHQHICSQNHTKGPTTIFRPGWLWGCVRRGHCILRNERHLHTYDSWMVNICFSLSFFNQCLWDFLAWVTIIFVKVFRASIPLLWYLHNAGISQTQVLIFKKKNFSHLQKF